MSFFLYHEKKNYCSHFIFLGPPYTMTAQKVATLMYDIKEKITDKEFKDIMDALGLVHKKNDRNVYELTYIALKNEIGKLEDGTYGHMITHQFKTKKVHLDTNLDNEQYMNTIIKNIRNGIHYSFHLEEQDDLEYLVLCKGDSNIVVLENIQNTTEDNGIPLQYDGIVLVDIKKL